MNRRKRKQIIKKDIYPLKFDGFTRHFGLIFVFWCATLW